MSKKNNNISDEHLRHSLFFLFASGKTTIQALAAIQETYGANIIKKTCLFKL